jgi:hypothetical protein
MCDGSGVQEAEIIARVRRMYRLLKPERDERRRGQWAAAESRELGFGGASVVARHGLSRPTITTGLRELELPAQERTLAAARIRRPGGGRRRLVEVGSGLLGASEELIDPVTRGDPDSPLRWTNKSTAKLVSELARQNHPVSDRMVATLLKQAGYSLQANRKTREGRSHPERKAQFEHINARVKAFHKRQPVISVDTKKKGFVWDFKISGRERRPKGTP